MSRLLIVLAPVAGWSVRGSSGDGDASILSCALGAASTLARVALCHGRGRVTLTCVLGGGGSDGGAPATVIADASSLAVFARGLSSDGWRAGGPVAGDPVPGIIAALLLAAGGGGFAATVHAVVVTGPAAAAAALASAAPRLGGLARVDVLALGTDAGPAPPPPRAPRGGTLHLATCIATCTASGAGDACVAIAIEAYGLRELEVTGAPVGGASGVLRLLVGGGGRRRGRSDESGGGGDATAVERVTWAAAADSAAVQKQQHQPDMHCRRVAPACIVPPHGSLAGLRAALLAGAGGGVPLTYGARRVHYLLTGQQQPDGALALHDMRCAEMGWSSGELREADVPPEFNLPDAASTGKILRAADLASELQTKASVVLPIPAHPPAAAAAAAVGSAAAAAAAPPSLLSLYSPSACRWSPGGLAPRYAWCTREGRPAPAVGYGCGGCGGAPVGELGAATASFPLRFEGTLLWAPPAAATATITTNRGRVTNRVHNYGEETVIESPYQSTLSRANPSTTLADSFRKEASDVLSILRGPDVDVGALVQGMQAVRAAFAVLSRHFPPPATVRGAAPFFFGDTRDTVLARAAAAAAAAGGASELESAAAQLWSELLAFCDALSGRSGSHKALADLAARIGGADDDTVYEYCTAVQHTGPRGGGGGGGGAQGGGGGAASAAFGAGAAAGGSGAEAVRKPARAGAKRPRYDDDDGDYRP